MNSEKIKDLAEQAGYLPDMFGIGHWDSNECHKFAELIIRECIEVSNINSQGSERTDDGKVFYYRNDISEQIKQNFGIE